jgi:CHASE2 domain-containing sensor protein
MQKLPRWPYWIDLVFTALLGVAGLFLASYDHSFVDLRALGGAALVAGLVLGGLDVFVLRSTQWALRLRTSVAFVLVVVPLAMVLTGRPEGVPLSIFALPNFALFWLGLWNLKSQR